MQLVLVIDDDPAVRQLTRLVLAVEGFEVEVASNGLEGLEKIQLHQPAVVILDLQMPVMDGATLFNRIDGPERPPIVIMSAYGADLATELPAEALVPKPYNPVEFIETVKALANG